MGGKTRDNNKKIFGQFINIFSISMKHQVQSGREQIDYKFSSSTLFKTNTKNFNGKTMKEIEHKIKIDCGPNPTWDGKSSVRNG